MKSIKVTRYEVPIAIRALKTVNIYSIQSDKHILLDTGMSPETVEFLEKRNFDFSSLDLIIMTHLHIDHIGGADAIRSKYSTPLAIGKEDAERIAFLRKEPETFQKVLLSFLTLNGTPPAVVDQIVWHHSFLDHNALYSEIEFDRTLNGDEDVAPNVSVVSNPGHSPGSKSIYLKREGVLLSGDHILPKITPNISFYDETSDMLGQYLNSLAQTRKLDVKEVMPGHGNPFDDLYGRIDEITHHHKDRLKEVISQTKDWRSAFEVASRITWSKNRPLDSMNLMEKNFAIGEAISHLTYLKNREIVESKEFNGVVKFKASGKLPEPL